MVASNLYHLLDLTTQKGKIFLKKEKKKEKKKSETVYRVVSAKLWRIILFL
jgi:hypothetical protein